MIGHEIVIEADSSKALPAIESIKEAKDRIRSTFRNVGIDLPKRKFILNLSPSHLRKVGTSFDLAMAVALLGLIHEGRLNHAERMGEFLFF